MQQSGQGPVRLRCTRGHSRGTVRWRSGPYRCGFPGHDPCHPSRERKHDVLPGKARANELRQWLRGWTDWRLLLIGVVMLGVELGEGSANNWLTLTVRDDHGQTAAIAAVFFAAFATGEAVRGSSAAQWSTGSGS